MCNVFPRDAVRGRLASRSPVHGSGDGRGNLGALTQDLAPTGSCRPRPGLGQRRLGLEVIYLQAIKLLENNGSNLGNVEHSVHVQYILPIYLSIIYPPTHPASCLATVVSGHLSATRCFSWFFPS